MLSIFAIHNYYRSGNPSGENVAFEAETRLLSRNGHTVYKYTRQSDEIAGFSVVGRATLPVRVVWSRASYVDLRRRLVQLRPDIAHFHNTFPLISPSAYLACRSLGVPIAQTLHNYRPLCLNGLFLRDGKLCEKCLPLSIAWPGILHRCYRNSLGYSSAVAGMQVAQRLFGMWKCVDLFIAPSEFLRRKYVAAGFPANKIFLKPNFAEISTSANGHDREHALFVGRLSAEKGARTLVAAWKLLPHIPLIVLGDGPQAHEIRSMAAGFGHISFPGAVSRDEVLDYLRRARYLVLPSEVNETFPLVMVEAFACNTPVITSPLGGPGEVVVDGRNGLLFETGNPNDLARQAERLWSNPAHAAELGTQARLDYEARFTPERNYQLLLQAYSQAIASRHMAASNGHTPG